VRRFSAAYLRDTRRGLWADREALDHLRLDELDTALDVGCGDGSLTAVLRESCDTIGCDRDRSLLAGVAPPVVQADAHRLPFRDAARDLVACQALLVNLPDPDRAITEFARVAAHCVAVIEPDNAAVEVESSVEQETDLARRTRQRYRDGVATDVALGAVPDRLRAAGLDDVRTAVRVHERTIEPPYDDRDLEHARRMASGEAIDDRRATILAGDTDAAAFDTLRTEWREVGRAVADAMAEGSYRRTERVPFHVTVGDVTS
jgi:SAM-dependent methyltransferase